MHLPFQHETFLHPNDKRRLTAEAERCAVMLSTYLVIYGHAVSKKDKKMATDALWDVLYEQLPCSDVYLVN